MRGAAYSLDLLLGRHIGARRNGKGPLIARAKRANRVKPYWIEWCYQTSGNPLMIHAIARKLVDNPYGPLALLAVSWTAGCGIPYIDATKVKRLEVVSYEDKTFCPTGITRLGVQAQMLDGTVRATNAPETNDQFNANTLQWKVSPSIGKVYSNQLDVAFLPNDDVSPVLDGHVELHVAMKDFTSAKGSIALTPNFACHQFADFGGADGRQGSRGNREVSAWGFVTANSGDDSSYSSNNGGPGRDATHVEAFVKLVAMPTRTLAMVRVKRASDGHTGTYYVDPARGRITIVNRGGRGGDGGIGTRGYSGRDGSSCASGGSGGDGGNGGYGGDGGGGGPITVHIDATQPELVTLLSVDNRGGDGGAGGSGGSGGRGGTDSKKKCSPSNGYSGRAGSPGMPGRRGMPGPEAQLVMDPPDQLNF